MTDQEIQEQLSSLRDMRSMMQRSSKFISLSGMAGIAAGVIALAGAGLFIWQQDINSLAYLPTLTDTTGALKPEVLKLILMDAALVLIVAIAAAYLFTRKKAENNSQPLFGPVSMLFFWNLMIPLTAGGLVCLILLMQDQFALVPCLSLVFYGLALFNASKFTLDDIKYLGITQVVLGVIAVMFPEYGIWLWMAGFGLAHIVYGAIMQFRQESE